MEHMGRMTTSPQPIEPPMLHRQVLPPGPSRAHGYPSTADDITSRLASLQRKNAAVAAATQRVESLANGSAAVNGGQYTNGHYHPPQQQQQSQPQPQHHHHPHNNHNLIHTHRREAPPPLSAAPTPPSPHSKSSRDRRRHDKNGEYDRGPVASGSRQLYDPSRSPVPPRSPAASGRHHIEPNSPPVPPLPPQHMDSRRDGAGPRRKLFDPEAPLPPVPPPAARRRTVDDGRPRRLFDPDASGPSNPKLFDPAVHDPMRFNSPTTPGALPPAPPSPSTVDGGSLAPPIRPSILRRTSPKVRTPEEEADLARERRRRKERSVEASSHHSSRRKDSDTRSKGSRGSRSSEGSASFKDRERGRGEGDSGAKAYLRAAYKEILAREQSLTDMHRKMQADPEAGISVLIEGSQPQGAPASDESVAWAELVAMHKELADCHYNFLKLALDPKAPPGLRPLPVKYNIPVRLWQVGFHTILERLRFAWMSHNPVALDLLTDVIYDAYQFYTELYEDQTMSAFRTAWIEALGDLARYRMAVASSMASDAPKKKRSDEARIDDDQDGADEPLDSGASIGQEVADNWDVEDKETWRTTARDWYAVGISERPGEGRLHHHLALLSRDVRGQEGRALYHFAKSLTASRPFETSRESVLPLFDSALQFQRSTPEATAMDLLVRLHGMLFTRIEMDNFVPVMSRFMERLEEDASLDGVSRKACILQIDWFFMGIVNIVALLQYGSDASIVRKALAQESAARRRPQAVEEAIEEAEQSGEQAEEEDGEGFDGEEDTPSQQAPSTTTPPSENTPPPATFTYALDLAFAVLDFVFAHPFRQQGIHQVLNPYLTILLTFVATLYRNPATGAPLLTHVPWRRLAEFVNSLGVEVREETRLVSGLPLPEDWVIRGMEWVGRRVYERGFWKIKSNSRGSSGGPALPRVGERFQSEMDVLTANFDSTLDITEGVVEEVDGADLTDGPVAVDDRRRRRVAWAAGILVAHVDGFELDASGRVVITGPLAAAIDEDEARKAAEREAEDKRREATRRARQPTPAEVEAEADGEDVQWGEEEGSDPELAVLRERRRHLRDILQVKAPTSGRSRRDRAPRTNHNVVPGYTILIFDTNVLLSALSLFSKVVEGGQWSVIVPLPVVTELDGLSKNPAPLGMEAQAAVSYLEARIRTHALCLKIQTSRGNYLTDLLIRAENLDFHAREQARTMDDMILNVAAFQRDHFVDRSGLLGQSSAVDGAATQVLLVTFDRNLRLKARARGIDAADEKEMAAILGR